MDAKVGIYFPYRNVASRLVTPRLVTQRFNALKEQNKVVSPTIAEVGDAAAI